MSSSIWRLKWDKPKSLLLLLWTTPRQRSTQLLKLTLPKWSLT
jgi:hypothetical protein